MQFVDNVSILLSLSIGIEGDNRQHDSDFNGT